MGRIEIISGIIRMKKNKIIVVAIILLFIICIIPIRFVDGYQTQGIVLPWFNIPGPFSSHNKSVDAIIWNYSDSYIKRNVVYDENTGSSLEQLTFVKSIKLFNYITVWRSERLCVYVDGELLDWNSYVNNSSTNENTDFPKVELKVNELVFEKDIGKKDVIVEATPLYGATIKSARLMNPQTGEEIQMQANNDGSYEAVTVVDTDISFDQNRLAEDVILKVYADLEDSECETEIKIRISAKEIYMINFVECHYYSYINSSAYMTDSSEERKNEIDKLMSSLQEQGYLEYYEINEDHGTLSYEVTDSGIPKQVQYTDN